MESYRYFVIYKPYGYLSQFRQEGGNPGLGDLFSLPKDVYPVGRLDMDSEGLLILSNDKRLNNQLLNPENQHWRTYLVQVDDQITERARIMLEEGVDIKLNKKNYFTMPAKARLVDKPSGLPERDPPVRFRKEIPTSWIELSLKEGKNRQVRRMTAAVGFPTLRLIRIRIGSLTLENMQPGQIRELDEKNIYQLLGIDSIVNSGSRPSQKTRSNKWINRN